MHQRQNKIELTRILLQLPDGTLRRLCSFGNPKDKLDESYLKLVFPDLHRQPLQKTLQNSQWEIQEIDVAPEGMSEFSYHYKGGIAHFKDALSSRIDQDWIVPDIQKIALYASPKVSGVQRSVVETVSSVQTLFA